MSLCEKRLVRSKSGLRIIPKKDSERSPFELTEPEWIKDCQIAACSACPANFDFVKRKHHCRRCGKIYCNTCCKTRLALPRMCFLDPVRLCALCAKITTEENSFYEKDLKILLAGVNLLVNGFPSASEPELVYCCLSSNHRYLLLSGNVSQSIPLVNVSTFSALENSEKTNENLKRLSFVALKNDTATKTELALPANDLHDAAPKFLRSLQKAFHMANEAKAVIGTGN